MQGFYSLLCSASHSHFCVCIKWLLLRLVLRCHCDKSPFTRDYIFSSNEAASKTHFNSCKWLKYFLSPFLFLSSKFYTINSDLILLMTTFSNGREKMAEVVINNCQPYWRIFIWVWKLDFLPCCLYLRNPSCCSIIQWISPRSSWNHKKVQSFLGSNFRIMVCLLGIIIRCFYVAKWIHVAGFRHQVSRSYSVFSKFTYF